MVWPGDETAADAERHGGLRASRADRERVVDVLKAAYVQDRLAKHEFDQRIGQVLASRTYAELDALTADIPAVRTRMQPAGPVRQPDPNKRRIRRATTGIGVMSMVTAQALMNPVEHPIAGLFVGVLVGGIAAALMAGLLTFVSWVLDLASGSQPAQGPPPGASGSVSGRSGPRPACRPGPAASLT